MGKVERVHLEPPTPRGIPLGQVDAILAVIPAQCRRDRLLFRLIAELGLRVGEALGLQIEDVDLTPDDEHLSVLGKGGRRRTVLIDGDSLVAQLRTCLRHTNYRHGSLFRAEKNGRGRPLRYQSAQEHWARYCAVAGVDVTLHQLRHTHATELVNGGVSLATIRKRLFHRNLQTTLRDAEQSDAVADEELRVWRRRAAQSRTRVTRRLAPGRLRSGFGISVVFAAVTTGTPGGARNTNARRSLSARSSRGARQPTEQVLAELEPMISACTPVCRLLRVGWARRSQHVGATLGD
jgi:hypothetical protein